MSVFSVPVTIGVNEERIAQEIEEHVEHEVIKNITTEVKKAIFRTDTWTGKVNENDNKPLREMIGYRIDKILADNKDDIVKEAAKILADKLVRSKTVRDIAAVTAVKACKEVEKC